jgi:hypothetical protein
MTNNYIPRNDSAFDNWFRALTQYIGPKTTGTNPAWPHVMQSSKTELNDAYAAFSKTLTPHTPADTVNKNEARAAAERVIRPFVQRFLHWPPVTDGDRVNMRIPNRDLVRTPHIEVTESVEFEMTLRKIREIVVNFWIKGETHKAKPAGYDGAVIIWDILDAPPIDPDNLTNHTMASKTPHRLEFREAERGKTVYIAAAWQNERGLIGQWSEIQSAVIP